MNLPPSDARNTVFKKYDQRAQEFISHGYRTTWWYLANKSLSDWSLLEGIELKERIILNVGCSEPIDEIYLSKESKKWIALDFSPASMVTASKIVNSELSSECVKRISFVTGDALSLPLKDESIDVVVSFSTIEHIPHEAKRKKSIEEIYRVLKKGGAFAITTSNRWNITYARWSKKMMMQEKTDFGYEYLFSPLELRRLLKSNNFRLVRFASELTILEPGEGYPRLISRFLRLFKYFGARIGFLAIK